MPASYLKAKQQTKSEPKQVDADLDDFADEVKSSVEVAPVQAKPEEAVEEEDLDSPASSYPGVLPTPKGVFPVRCLVETMCGEDDGPEQWFPADVIEVKPVEAKKKVPINKLEPDDGGRVF